MKVSKHTASGVLGELLANIDQRELARTRKRMMLAAKIEEAMKKRGFNQKQFARLMGKSEAVISEWLSGDRNFTIDTLTDIEEILDVQLLNVTVMTRVQSGTENVISIGNRQKCIRLQPTGTWEEVAPGAHSFEYKPSYAI